MPSERTCTALLPELGNSYQATSSTRFEDSKPEVSLSALYKVYDDLKCNKTLFKLNAFHDISPVLDTI